MKCDAKIKPMVDDIVVSCNGDHKKEGQHSGDLKDFAYPGSVTTITWLEGDRRSFNGDWPGQCPECNPLVHVPVGHLGKHVAR